MKISLVTLFQPFLKRALPSLQGSKLLDEGYEALKNSDFFAAKQIYNRISQQDKETKKVEGFFAAITKKEAEKVYQGLINKKYGIK